MIYFFIIHLLFLETAVLALPLLASRRAEAADHDASDASGRTSNLLFRRSPASGSNNLHGQPFQSYTLSTWAGPVEDSNQASDVTTDQKTPNDHQQTSLRLPQHLWSDHPGQNYHGTTDQPTSSGLNSGQALLATDETTPIYDRRISQGRSPASGSNDPLTYQPSSPSFSLQTLAGSSGQAPHANPSLPNFSQRLTNALLGRKASRVTPGQRTPFHSQNSLAPSTLAPSGSTPSGVPQLSEREKKRPSSRYYRYKPSELVRPEGPNLKGRMSCDRCARLGARKCIKPHGKRCNFCEHNPTDEKCELSELTIEELRAKAQGMLDA